MINRVILGTVLAVMHCSIAMAEIAEQGELAALRLPEGFHVEIFISDLPNARSMTLGSRTLFVGTRKAGAVYAVPIHEQPSGTFQADRPIVIADGLNLPNGVAFLDGSLYVAENHRIIRFDDIEDNLDSPGYLLVSDELPSARHHGWRYLAVGPDRKLYFQIGAPCNVCREAGYAVIVRMNPDGSGRSIYAEGVRNSVGITWQPGSNVMWFTDNGRDWLGDDLPPCELNRAPSPGLHFGFPYCHGADIPDPDLNEGRSCDQFTPPAMELGPHVAPLGLKFYTGGMFPEEYRGRILIAEHGSWNRSVPIGYRITMVDVEGSKASNYRVFAEGWLREDGSSWGRPVDLLMLPDGSLLVSDDKAGQIYRISYSAERS